MVTKEDRDASLGIQHDTSWNREQNRVVYFYLKKKEKKKQRGKV